MEQQLTFQLLDLAQRATVAAQSVLLCQNQNKIHFQLQLRVPRVLLEKNQHLLRTMKQVVRIMYCQMEMGATEQDRKNAHPVHWVVS
jgi:hypothetical protein